MNDGIGFFGSAIIVVLFVGLIILGMIDIVAKFLIANIGFICIGAVGVVLLVLILSKLENQPDKTPSDKPLTDNQKYWAWRNRNR